MLAIAHMLRAERCVRGGRKVTYDASLAEQPRGAMFEYEYLLSSLRLLITQLRRLMAMVRPKS